MSAARAVPSIGLAVLVVLLASVMTGCAGGTGDGPAATAGGGTGGLSAAGGQAMIDAQAELATCLRKHGVDVPGPTANGSPEFDPRAAGISEERLRVAEAKCDRERRAVADAAPKLSNADRQAALGGALRYARCMRRHGRDVPDPRPSDPGGGTSVDVPAGSKDNPAFQAASRDCEQAFRGDGTP
jgi:hypothetical protein